MAVTGTEGAVLLVGRVLFGGILAFMGLNHFMQYGEMTGYAEFKGLPAPGPAVALSGLVLVLGGLSLITGVYPVVGAALLAGFLVIAAVTMHDFWAVDPEETQDEMTNFLKNVALAGGALAFGAFATEGWAFSVGLGLL
jgi:putative oxidoreductase